MTSNHHDPTFEERAPERITVAPGASDAPPPHLLRRPHVLAGAVGRWHARTWTFDRLRAEHGDVVFPVSRSYSRSSAAEHMSLREYLDALESPRGGDGLYLSGVELLSRIPSLANDFAFPRYVRVERLSNTLIFIGSGRSRTPLHFDYCHTLLAQVMGRKRVTLFSPEKTRHLSPLPREPFQTFSGLELTRSGEARADRSAYEAARRDHADFDFTLHPGEILYLPYGHWHGVESLEPSISVSRSWWTVGMLLTQAPHVAADWLSYQRGRLGRSAGAADASRDWLGF
jgi:hypothetical protein